METVNNLLVSFSGGETSAFMGQWLNNHYKDYGYDRIVFVFANTGLENEETLEFVRDCSIYFGIEIHWIESLVYHGNRKGSGYSVTSFEGADRGGVVFEDMIKKYGIPNLGTPHCTRELKQNPIKAFARDYFNGEKYDTAIGIRQDEMDRMNPKYKKKRFVYPLIHKNMIPMTKPMINFFWKQMPFRLNLKGYQGNCATCWKKSDSKLFQIAKESPDKFNFMKSMEAKYGGFMPQSRIEKHLKEGKEIPTNFVFFRKNRSTKDILIESALWDGNVPNDADVYTWQIDLLGGDSCEVFSDCN